jgi:hypothetical protein
VQSLALLKAAPMPVPSVQQFVDGLGTLVGMYMAGQKAEAIGAFERMAVGPDYRPGLDSAMPGWFDQAVADADTFSHRSSQQYRHGPSRVKMPRASRNRYWS